MDCSRWVLMCHRKCSAALVMKINTASALLDSDNETCCTRACEIIKLQNNVNKRAHAGQFVRLRLVDCADTGYTINLKMASCSSLPVNPSCGRCAPM